MSDVLLQAASVWAVAGDDLDGVWFSDAQGHYLGLCRQKKPTERDRRLSLADVLIERNGQTRDAGGGITHCELHRDVLTLALTERKAEYLGLGADLVIEVRFMLPPAGLQELRQTLGNIFEGRGYYADRIG
jgi:hypothetical protein